MIFDTNERYYSPGAQPDCLGNGDSFGSPDWSSDEVIENLYEPLRLANSGYITRENIGRDATGAYDMWCYCFTPESYELTVYLQAGTHGWHERAGYFGLARIMTLITNAATDEQYLYELRTKVRFIVIPIVNVFDVTERRYPPCNGNNVNLNRDCLNGDARQRETKNVMAIMERYKDEIDFGFDLHTDPEGSPGWGGYLLCYPDNVPDYFSDSLKRINNYLYGKYLTGIKKAFMGNSSNYPANSSIDVNADPDYERAKNHNCTFVWVMWALYGFCGATLEHGDRKFSSEKCTALEMTRAVELYLNHIIEGVRLNMELKRKECKKI